MPDALSIGIEWNLFWSLNPKKLEPFAKAHKKRVKEQDAMIHSWIGSYGISALIFAISKCFNKSSQYEYIKEPIYSKNDISEKEDLPLTEEEKKAKTEQLFMKLKIMGLNHSRNNKKEVENG